MQATGSLPSLHEVASGVRFVGALPRFLRNPLTLPEARSILQQRWLHREANFLATIRSALAHEDGPYLQLFRVAGCEYGDAERLVGQDGVEGAMLSMYREGIWLSVDELKGRRPAVRGNTTIAVNPSLLRRPQATRHFTVRTSGSGGLAAPMDIDLASERDSAVNLFLSFYARGALAWEKGHCSVPGGSALNGLLKHAAAGTPIRRWFCPVDPATSGLHPRYLWSARALRMGGWI